MKGVQGLVVFGGVVAALVLGLAGAVSASTTTIAGWLAIGFVPAMWGALRVIERSIGHEIWHYTAPYPPTTNRAEDARSRERRKPQAWGSVNGSVDRTVWRAFQLT